MGRLIHPRKLTAEGRPGLIDAGRGLPGCTPGADPPRWALLLQQLMHVHVPAFQEHHCKRQAQEVTGRTPAANPPRWVCAAPVARRLRASARPAERRPCRCWGTGSCPLQTSQTRPCTESKTRHVTNPVDLSQVYKQSAYNRTLSLGRLSMY